MTISMVVAMFALILMGFMHSIYRRSKQLPVPIELLSQDNEGRKKFLLATYYKYKVFPGGVILGFSFVFFAMLYSDINAQGLRSENISLAIVNIIYGLSGAILFYRLLLGSKEDRLKPATPEFLEELRNRNAFPNANLIFAYVSSFSATVLLVWLFIFSGYLSLY